MVATLPGVIESWKRDIKSHEACFVVSEGPQWFIWTVLAWVICIECIKYDSKRARALQTSFYLLGRHRDAMRQWLKKRLSELLYARARLKYLCLSIPKHT